MLWRPIEDRRRSQVEATIIETKALTKRCGVFTPYRRRSVLSKVGI
jgi:hypothetical protein